MTNGIHHLTIFANDTVGNTGTSEIVIFAVSLPLPTSTTDSEQAEPFPATLAITASGGSIALAGFGLAIYFKKYKRQSVAEKS